MFSRSEKNDEALDPMAEPEDGERSPMVLAALAGLLAIAGAFLLVFYLNSGGDDVAADGTSGSGSGGATEEIAESEVFVVTQTIPRGTSAAELAASPQTYLTSEFVPERFIAASAITSIGDLQALSGQVLASDVLPGEQLLAGRFRDPANFDAPSETFLEAESGIPAPEGHHSVVFELPSTRAIGGFIRPGEKATVVGNFRVSPPEGQAFEISVVVLNSVEILNVTGALDTQGQLASDVNQVGIANRGNIVVTVAVKPEELTDMTYAIQYGEIYLASALDGLTNEDGPRAITTMDQIAGDDGVWLAELDNGNLVDLIGPLLEDGVVPEGQSITLDLSDGSDGPQPDDDTNTDLAPAPEDDVAPDSDLVSDAPGDS